MKANRWQYAATALVLALVAGTACGAERQDAAAVRRSVGEFVARETAGLPGQVNYTVGAVDPQLALPACHTLQPFLPVGARLWGNATVGVRCTSPMPWTLYVTVDVHVLAEVVQTAGPTPQNQPLQRTDLVMQQADLTALPAGVLTNPNAAIGKTLVTSLGAGQPLRIDMLRAPIVIQQGQPVKLVVHGHGFTVSSEGRAITAASAGQLVQVRVPSGYVVSGLARNASTVEVTQ